LELLVSNLGWNTVCPDGGFVAFQNILSKIPESLIPFTISRFFPTLYGIPKITTETAPVV
jgi:hypothetical protein